MTATALTLRPGFASLTDALAHYGRRAWPASSVVPQVAAEFVRAFREGVTDV